MVRGSAFSLLVLGASAMAALPAAAYTVDNATGNNANGSARYTDPDQQFEGLSSRPGLSYQVWGDSYSSGDMLIPKSDAQLPDVHGGASIFAKPAVPDTPNPAPSAK